MSITPFHFESGFLLSELTARNVSFLLFIIIQVIIDVESVFNIVMGNYPVHHYAHSFAGNIILTIVLSAIFHVAKTWLKSFRFFGGLNLRIVIITTLIGSLSHTFFDSIMHSDAQPFSPITAINPFLGINSLPFLHDVCVYSALIGFVIFSFRKLRSRKKSNV